MSRSGRRGTCGQVGAGGGGGGPDPGFVNPTANTITAVRAALAGAAAGIRCRLYNLAGTLVAGTWVADGAGGSTCCKIDWGLVDASSCTVGDADTYDIEVDTGSSIAFSAAGLTPLAGLATKIVYHGLGEAGVGRVNLFDCVTTQNVTAISLINDVFFGGGFYMPRAGFASRLVASAFGYSTVGLTWRTSAAYNAWPLPSIGLGIPATLDASGRASCMRSPRGDGTSTTSLLLANYIGDASGPNVGVATQISAATDLWSEAGRKSIPANFYDPKTSDLVVSIRSVSFTG